MENYTSLETPDSQAAHSLEASNSIQGARQWDSKTTLERLRIELADFAGARDWNQFHQPRNLLLAMVGEVGELAELFQWRGEVHCGLPDFADHDKQLVAEELSDVLLYLIRLADACHIDLGRAALEKMKKNAAKYPVDKCRGSSQKYTTLQEQPQEK